MAETAAPAKKVLISHETLTRIVLDALKAEKWA